MVCEDCFVSVAFDYSVNHADLLGSTVAIKLMDVTDINGNFAEKNFTHQVTHASVDLDSSSISFLLDVATPCSGNVRHLVEINSSVASILVMVLSVIWLNYLCQLLVKLKGWWPMQQM